MRYLDLEPSFRGKSSSDPRCKLSRNTGFQAQEPHKSHTFATHTKEKNTFMERRCKFHLHSLTGYPCAEAGSQPGQDTSSSQDTYWHFGVVCFAWCWCLETTTPPETLKYCIPVDHTWTLYSAIHPLTCPLKMLRASQEPLGECGDFNNHSYQNKTLIRI